jgi:hypothetical protein
VKVWIERIRFTIAKSSVAVIQLPPIAIILRDAIQDPDPHKEQEGSKPDMFGHLRYRPAVQYIHQVYHLFPSSLKSFPCLSLSSLASNSCCACSLSLFLASSPSTKVCESPNVDPSLCSLRLGSARRDCGCCGRWSGAEAPPRRRRSHEDSPGLPSDWDCG